jgi:hypothetical protein
MNIQISKWGRRNKSLTEELDIMYVDISLSRRWSLINSPFLEYG